MSRKALINVTHRSFRRTSECFLSSLLCKVGIMLAKGKASKVPTAAARREPVWDSPEGSGAERLPSQGP